MTIGITMPRMRRDTSSRGEVRLNDLYDAQPLRKIKSGISNIVTTLNIGIFR